MNKLNIIDLASEVYVKEVIISRMIVIINVQHEATENK